VQSAEFVENRKNSAFDDAARKSASTLEFDSKLKRYMKEVLSIPAREKRQKQEEVLKDLKEYIHDPNKPILLPNDVPFEKQLENIKCIGPAILNDWIKMV
jgi:hypothetical protein